MCCASHKHRAHTWLLLHLISYFFCDISHFGFCRFSLPFQRSSGLALALWSFNCKRAKSWKRKIHKKLLDFSYFCFVFLLFYFLATFCLCTMAFGVLKERERRQRWAKLLLYAYAGWLDGWLTGRPFSNTHTFTYTHTPIHNRGKLGRNIFKAIFLMRYRLMVCCLSLHVLFGL